jgi:tetratricopeptide (TPR) repeat protein
MGWLGKLFGGGATVDGLRKATEQKRFADARLLAEQLSEQVLSEVETAEVEQLRIVAGDGLARLNLGEALGMRNSGEYALAEEHLQLALGQACSAALRQQIKQVQAEVPVVPEVTDLTPRGSACGSCGPQPTVSLAAEDVDLPDAESQLELVLISYPTELAARYRQKGKLFLQALLLSHSGDDAEALPLWQQVAASEQDDLYWFELGAALARSGDLPAARAALEKALQLNAELLLAIESLVPVLLGLGEAETAQLHLQQLLATGQEPGFCHAQLALLCLQKQQLPQASTHIRQALLAGVTDPSFLLLAATVAEQAGELGEAETILQGIPAGGGCGGGISLPLAEFLLRQKRDLARVLDTFNAACRQEPDNPRWQLRVAQTYLARNWQKDGLKLLRMVVGDPRLEPELQQDAEKLLATLQG